MNILNEYIEKLKIDIEENIFLFMNQIWEKLSFELMPKLEQLVSRAIIQ